MKTNFIISEVEFVAANTLTNRRNNKFVFATSNHCKIGLNIPSNRFRSVSNMIEKEWMDIEKDSFKLKEKLV